MGQLAFEFEWSREGREGGEIADRRMTIARHFNAGFNPQMILSPGGTTGFSKIKSLAITKPRRRPFSRPGGTLAAAGDDPALKRRAIVELSRWDERGRMVAVCQDPAKGGLGWTNGANGG